MDEDLFTGSTNDFEKINPLETINQVSLITGNFGGFLFVIGIIFSIFFLYSGIFVGIIPAVLLILIGANLKARKTIKKNFSTHEKDATDDAGQAHNSFVAERKEEPKTVKIDYYPLFQLCAETHNDNSNRYTPFDEPITVEIKYNDSNGEMTNRKIDVKYIAKSDYNENYYINAFCHLRDETRNFVVERILQTTVNGAEVDFIKYLVGAYKKSNQYKQIIKSNTTFELLTSFSNIGYTARILIYISRIDGIFTRKEKTIVADFLDKTAAREDIDIDDFIAGVSDLNITVQEFKNSIKSAEITDSLIAKAEEIAGKDSLRLGALDLLKKEYAKREKERIRGV